MSDFAIFIMQGYSGEGSNSAPWSWIQVVDGGYYQLRLTSGKTGTGGWTPGFIPRDGAVSQIDLAVDLEAGGDYEQLRTVTIQIADQMANGQSIDAWLQSIGMSLAGAAVAVYSPAPTSYPPGVEPIWTGVIRSSRLTDTRLEFACESPQDSDPLGEIVSDSAIRPIVYGTVQKVKLPSLPVECAAITRLMPISTRSSQYSDPDSTVSTWPMPGSDSAALITYWTHPVYKRHFVDLDVGPTHPDLSDWLTPGSIAGSWFLPSPSEWYVECTSGTGKGTVRRIKAGSEIFIVSEANWWGATYVRLRIEVDAPLVSLENGSPICTPSFFQNAHYTDGVFDGYYEASVSPQTEVIAHVLMRDGSRRNSDVFVKAVLSYFRIIQKKYKFAIPVSSNFDASSKVYAPGSNSNFLPANSYNDLFSIEGNTLVLSPPADSISEIACYTPLLLDPAVSAVLRKSVYGGSDDVDVARVFSMLAGGSPIVQIFRQEPTHDAQTWNPNARLVLMFGNPGWDLSGASKIIFCPHFDFGYSDPAGQPLSPNYINYAVQVYRSNVTEIGNMPILAGTDDPANRTMSYKTPGSRVSTLIDVGAVPKASLVDTSYDWESQAVHLALPDGYQTDLVALSVLIGYYNPDSTSGDHAGATFRMRLYDMTILAVRNVSISDIYVDINGPNYTGATWWNRINGAWYEGFPDPTPLTSGMTESDPISDHAHAYEDIFRRYAISPWMKNGVDSAAIEQACVDLWTKTQISGIILAPQVRPRLAVAINDSSPQVGDVCAQLCRDSNLVGSRTGSGMRTVKAFLARTLLQEEDAVILESDLLRGSISEAPASPLSKLCSAPLIRFAQQGGAPTQYIQVSRPDASAWQSSYTLGFPDDASAMRAWSICHRGWLESGAAHAREIRMDTIPDISSLLALVMQPRGTTFFDWLSRPKRTLAPTVALSHQAARLPRGSRIKLFHWKYAPSGAWGTLRRVNMNPQADTASLEIVMDLSA